MARQVNFWAFDFKMTVILDAVSDLDEMVQRLDEIGRFEDAFVYRQQITRDDGKVTANIFEMVPREIVVATLEEVMAERAQEWV